MVVCESLVIIETSCADAARDDDKRRPMRRATLLGNCANDQKRVETARPPVGDQPPPISRKQPGTKRPACGATISGTATSRRVR
jgi:hypothetical protein